MIVLVAAASEMKEAMEATIKSPRNTRVSPSCEFTPTREKSNTGLEMRHLPAES